MKNNADALFFILLFAPKRRKYAFDAHTEIAFANFKRNCVNNFF